MAEDNNIFCLTDDEGNQEEFEFLDVVEYDGCEYAVLYPTSGDMDNGELVILQVEDLNEEEDAYIDVDDEEILEAVYEIFKERHKDEFEFE